MLKKRFSSLMMRKIVILVILAVFLAGCASVPSDFDPTVNPFIGEWGHVRRDLNADELFLLQYIFTGDNQVTIIRPGIPVPVQTGTYRFTHNRITFNVNNRSWQMGYFFNGENNLILESPNNPSLFTFTRHPYYNNFYALRTNESAWNNALANREEVLSIQGSWVNINSGATYTISGNEFTLINGRVRTSGTIISINDNLIGLIASDNRSSAILSYELLNNSLFFHAFGASNNFSLGTFIKR